MVTELHTALPRRLAQALERRKQFVDNSSEIACSIGIRSETEDISFKQARDLEKQVVAGRCGLRNQGATCYLNSLLQCLFHCLSFRNDIISFPFDESVHGSDVYCLTRQLQTLFAQMTLSFRAALSTTALTKSFGWSCTDAMVQQDVQECMAVIFEAIDSQSRLTCTLSSVRHWQGELLDELVCLTCNKSRSQIIDFRDLQLSLANFNCLEESLGAFFESEIMEGVTCEDCQSRTLHRKGYQLKSVPRFLSLQLKRFDMNWDTLQRVKVNRPIRVPREIALGFGVDAVSCELVAVLMHCGSAFAGHYSCYTKDFEGECPRWLLYNDATVRVLSDGEVEECFGAAPEASAVDGTKGPKSSSALPRPDESAYMLVYRRLDMADQTQAELPDDLKCRIDEDNAAFLKDLENYELEKSFVNVSIVDGAVCFSLKLARTASVGELLERVYHELNARLPPDTVHSIDNLQLRGAASLLSAQTCELNVDMRNSTLDQLPPSLLTRSLAVGWKDFSGVPVQLSEVVWNSFSNQLEFSPPKRCTLDPYNVLASAEACLGYSSGETKDLLLCRLDESSGEATVLFDTKNSIRKGNFQEVANESLFVEFSPPTATGWKLLDHFQNLKMYTNCHVQVCKEGDDDPRVCSVEKPLDIQREFEVRVNGHMPLKHLKEEIACRLNCTVDKFSLFKRVVLPQDPNSESKQSIFCLGREIKDLNGEICAQIEEAATVLVAHCKPQSVSESLVLIYVESSQINGSISRTVAPGSIEAVLFGHMTVCGNTRISELKQKIFAILRNRADSLILRNLIDSSDASNLPIRLRAMPNDNQRKQISAKLGPVLQDELILEDIRLDGFGGKRKKFIDDVITVCVQIGPECCGVFGNDDLLVNIRYWSFLHRHLSPAVEMKVSKTTSVRDLKTNLAKYFDLPFEVDDMLLVKPFSWQLSDIANMESLTWKKQPQDTEDVGKCSLKLTDSCVVVAASRKDAQKNAPKVFESPTIAATVALREEVGFRLYSVNVGAPDP